MKRRDFIKAGGVAPLGLLLDNHQNSPKVSPPDPRLCFDPWLEINMNNMAWNVKQIRNRINNRPIMAVIKGNGYGHGLLEMAVHLKKNNLNHLAVGKVEEAICLRENGTKGMVLNFGPFCSQHAEEIIKHKISQSIYTEAVLELQRPAQRLKQNARVHIKIDTGLGRVGVPYYQALDLIKKVASLPWVKIEGVFTTLSEDADLDKRQLQRFLEICEAAKKIGINTGIRHAAASAAVAVFPESFLDMVRPGSCIYGIEPLANLNLKPVMSFKTRIVYVKSLRKGDAVSYHQKFKAKKETLLATLPVGYSDGYPWQAVKQAHVLIKGQPWPLVAAVTANHITINISGANNIMKLY